MRGVAIPLDCPSDVTQQLMVKPHVFFSTVATTMALARNRLVAVHGIRHGNGRHAGDGEPRESVPDDQEHRPGPLVDDRGNDGKQLTIVFCQ